MANQSTPPCKHHKHKDHYHCDRCGCPVFYHEDSTHRCPPGFLTKLRPVREAGASNRD